MSSWFQPGSLSGSGSDQPRHQSSASRRRAAATARGRPGDPAGQIGGRRRVLTRGQASGINVSLLRQSIFGGVAVAGKLGSAALPSSARAAFTQGMDAALIVSAAIALAGLILTVAFLPNTKKPGKTTEPGVGQDTETVSAR